MIKTVAWPKHRVVYLLGVGSQKGGDGTITPPWAAINAVEGDLFTQILSKIYESFALFTPRM